MGDMDVPVKPDELTEIDEIRLFVHGHIMSRCADHTKELNSF